MTTIYYEDGQYVSTVPDVTHTPEDAGVISFATIFALVESFVYGQSNARSAIGDAIIATYHNQAWETKVPYARIWEAYITGVIEFVATVSSLHFTGYTPSLPPV